MAGVCFDIEQNDACVHRAYLIDWRVPSLSVEFLWHHAMSRAAGQTDRGMFTLLYCCSFSIHCIKLPKNEH